MQIGNAIKTSHEFVFQDSKDMSRIPDGSVHLVVTSPPYPMVSMWDEMFSRDPAVESALAGGDGDAAFDLMHARLEPVWRECFRVLREGGIACINIGDAVRTIDGSFRLFNSHSRIVRDCLAIGFQALPAIIWRKQTNAPNKFMGSGMLPPGAYVTLEHEYVLIFRKGDKRAFGAREKANRRESAFFWEERNTWFSDVWFDIKGARQTLAGGEARERSAAFPFELPYRLVNMFSVKGDTVLDPFSGAGTTSLAAMSSQRNSIGVEIDPSLREVVEEQVKEVVRLANGRIWERLAAHDEFVEKRKQQGKQPSKTNVFHGVPCMSAQETGLAVFKLMRIEKDSTDRYVVTYDPTSWK